VLAKAGPRPYICGNKLADPMNPFIWLILTLINLYIWIILATVISSWLVHFGIINYSNPTVRAILRGLAALTEPVLGPIRRILPNMGGLDISPMIALIGLLFLYKFVDWYLPPLLG
jgi:YggT family protein